MPEARMKNKKIISCFAGNSCCPSGDLSDGALLLMTQLDRRGVKALLRRHLENFPVKQFDAFAGRKETCVGHSVVFVSSPESRVGSPYVVLHTKSLT